MGHLLMLQIRAGPCVPHFRKLWGKEWGDLPHAQSSNLSREEKRVQTGAGLPPVSREVDLILPGPLSSPDWQPGQLHRHASGSSS